jgi:mannose-6-phosphate isomerase-like protein (cupin superfamily)
MRERKPSGEGAAGRDAERIREQEATMSDREPKIVDKPWGREVWYAHTDRYAGKVLEVDEGHRLSLQKHEVKHETLFLQSGRMRFTLGEEEFEWAPGERIEVPPDTVHRMEALEDSVILEVSTPELDDVVRLEDDYERR